MRSPAAEQGTGSEEDLRDAVGFHPAQQEQVKEEDENRLREERAGAGSTETAAQGKPEGTRPGGEHSPAFQPGGREEPKSPEERQNDTAAHTDYHSQEAVRENRS